MFKRLYGTPEARFWNKVVKAKDDDCWDWAGTKWKGYGKHKVAGKSVHAHRFSWEIANGPIPSGLMVCHKCDNPSCVNPLHLFLGTNQDNMTDMVEKGRAPKLSGAKNPNSVLTEAMVISIRADGRTLTAIAKDYGVTFGLIGHIKKRRLWKHI